MIAGLGLGAPPGASATTAWMRVSVSGKARAVQPPTLWPTMAIGIGSGGTRNLVGEHVVEQEAGVGNAVGDEALDMAGDLRSDDFGMIEGRDQVAVTRQVGVEAGGGATAAAAVVRVEDERPRAGSSGHQISQGKRGSRASKVWVRTANGPGAESAEVASPKRLMPV
jgi:hypothetical protein